MIHEATRRRCERQMIQLVICIYRPIKGHSSDYRAEKQIRPIAKSFCILCLSEWVCVERSGISFGEVWNLTILIISVKRICGTKILLTRYYVFQLLFEPSHGRGRFRTEILFVYSVVRADTEEINAPMHLPDTLARIMSVRERSQESGIDWN